MTLERARQSDDYLATAEAIGLLGMSGTYMRLMILGTGIVATVLGSVAQSSVVFCLLVVGGLVLYVLMHVSQKREARAKVTAAELTRPGFGEYYREWERRERRDDEARSSRMARAIAGGATDLAKAAVAPVDDKPDLRGVRRDLRDIRDKLDKLDDRSQ